MQASFACRQANRSRRRSGRLSTSTGRRRRETANRARAAHRLPRRAHASLVVGGWAGIRRRRDHEREGGGDGRRRGGREGGRTVHRPWGVSQVGRHRSRSSGGYRGRRRLPGGGAPVWRCNAGRPARRQDDAGRHRPPPAAHDGARPRRPVGGAGGRSWAGRAAPRHPGSSAMMATIGRAVRGLAAAVALAALLGGVPALLVVGVGWPLPTSLPDWHAVENTFTQQGVPPRMVVDVLALVCWTAWALIVVSFFVEAAAVLRRRQPPSVPLAGPLQSIVGALVAVIAVAVLSGGAGRHATPAGRPTPLAEVVARTVVSTGGQTMAQEVGNPAAPGPVYVVRHRDTLWGIAQRELGDA